MRWLGLLLLLGCGEITQSVVPDRPSFIIDCTEQPEHPDCQTPPLATLSLTADYDARRLPFYPPSVFPVSPDSVVFVATGLGITGLVTELRLNFGHGLSETMIVSTKADVARDVLKLGGVVVEVVWTVRGFLNGQEVISGSRVWRLPQPWPAPSSPCAFALMAWSYHGISYIRLYCGA